jgi:probable addiction module antidote protein
MRKLRSFQAFHLEELKDPEKVKAYIDVALEEYQRDNDVEAFLLALRDVAEAQGGLGELAKRTGLNRPNIYKVLSPHGNPRINTIGTILRSMGLRLSVDFAAVETPS